MKNPGLYRRMSEPFASAEEATAAINAFFDDLAALREKHRIADVHVIAKTNAIETDGEEHVSISRYHLGDALHAESMCAYAYGAETQARKALITSLLSGK